MTDTKPGYWSCEGCGRDVRPGDARKEWVPGYDGDIMLAFCPECTRERGAF